MDTNEPDITHTQEEVRNTEVAYDATDLSARAVVIFLIILAVGGALITFSMWGSYKYIIGASALAPQTPNPVITSKQELQAVGGDPALKFPEPRLQPDPVADLNRFRTREEEILNSYGWEDQANGKVHIPIERAMDLISTVGLPVHPEATGAAPRSAPSGAAVQGSASASQVKQ